MKNRKTHFVLLFFSTLYFLTAAYAQVTPVGDSYTNSTAPTTNYGANVLLNVDGAKEIAYIQFNLASIPASASVSQATLKLYVNAVTAAGSLNVDYINGTWSESAITYDMAPALGTTIASNVAVTTADKNQYILINITSAVQAWLSGSEPNDGIALVANGAFNGSFDSKENTTTSHSPELDVAFAGGDGTITGITTASSSGLTGGGTSGTLNLSLTNACATNQVLQWNGTAWVCASAGTGTITGVTAGTDLAGGGTSGNVTLNLNTTALNSSYAQLAAANTFTANQTVNANLTVLNNSSYQPLLVQSSSSFGTWLELSNTGTGGQTWNFLSAGSGNSEGAGNLGITNLNGGTIWLEGPTNVSGVLHSSGNANPITTAQGAYFGWNALTGGTGETDFINNEGKGSGGFAFMNTPASGSPRTTLMTISPGVGAGITGSLSAASQSYEYAAIQAVGFYAASGSGADGTPAIVAYGGTTDPQTGDPDAIGIDSFGGTSGPYGGDGIAGQGGQGSTIDGIGGVFQGGQTSTGGDGIYAWEGSGYAGYFFGNVDVAGTLSKSSGSFKIDDPIDPANKYLYHSFVESPDMKNVYDGVATLDAIGEAVIQMPEWFGMLNRDFRYQLTCIGTFAPVYISEELANNQFKIGGGRAGMKVSWQLTGIRQDAWANAHRIPVEEAKKDAERGFYIHPELYGAPAEKQIEWARHPQLMKRLKYAPNARQMPPVVPATLEPMTSGSERPHAESARSATGTIVGRQRSPKPAQAEALVSPKATRN